MADGITRSFAPDPKLDLVLERVVEVPPELVWAAWTQPEHLKVWFTPAPWRTTHCEIDLRPGGIFRTVMEGPAGERFDGTGCYLEVVPNRRLVWTSVLLPHWRPAPPGGELPFTGVIDLEPAGTGWCAPVLSPWLEKAVDRASRAYFGKPPVYMGEGGSIPFMAMLGAKFPKAQFLITGVLGPQSNAHGPNEFLHIPMGKRLTACVAEVVAEHKQAM